MSIIVLLLAFLVKQAIPQTPQAPPQTNTGVIEGIITKAGTGALEPIPGVSVQLNIAQAARGAGITPDQTVLDAATDEMGHFIFKDLYPGRYQLRYTLDGYFVLPDGVEGNGVSMPQQSAAGSARGGASAVIAFVLDTQQPYKLTIQTIPGGVISGRVSDSTGRPVINGQMSAMRIQYQDGLTTLASTKTAMTNDRGEFRIFGLEPGDYYVRSEYRRASNVPGNPQETLRAYYPGVDDPNSAAPIPVHSGSESSGSNIIIRPTTTVNVDGTVVIPGSLTATAATPALVGPRGNAIGLAGPAAATFYLIPLDPAGLRDDTAARPSALFSDADRTAGKFELRNVRPGRYDLYAIVRTNPADPQERHIGHSFIDVGNQDLGGINIMVTPGVDLKARVTSSDTAARSQAPVQLALRMRDAGAQSALLAQTGQRGQARGATNDDWRIYPGLTEGRYVLDSPMQTLRDAYVADIRQGDKSIYETGTIVIGSTTPDPVEVILARPAATIDGAVQNAFGKPGANASVILIPNGDRRQNPMLYKRVNADTDGKFSLKALAPGAYKLFAWESIPSGAELNAEFMKEYDDRGSPITLEAGAQLKVQLPLIPAGKP